MAYLWLVLILSLSSVVAVQNQIGTANASFDFGVCFGTLGNNLPSAIHAVNLYKKYNIGTMRLFNPNPDVLNAVRERQIDVIVGVPNEDIPSVAASQDAANSWFATNIQPYVNDVIFSLIAVGNEAIPGNFANQILNAMTNLQNVIDAHQLGGIRLTTVLSGTTLGTSFPPSAGAFTPEASAVLGGILNFLSTKGSPIMINVYPYFAYAADPANVRLDYAQFTAPGTVVRDGNLNYQNLFDAMIDAFISAMEKLGSPNVDVVVSESGCPSDGNGNFTTPELASTYNHNFFKRMLARTGTPKRPTAYIQGSIVAMFNEDLKPAGAEQHFGLFYPNMQPVYSVFS